MFKVGETRVYLSYKAASRVLTFRSEECRRSYSLTAPAVNWDFVKLLLFLGASEQEGREEKSHYSHQLARAKCDLCFWIDGFGSLSSATGSAESAADSLLVSVSRASLMDSWMCWTCNTELVLHPKVTDVK